MVINFRLVGGVLLALGIVQSAVAADALPGKAADIYRLTNVWSLHLKFDPAEWDAMEPKGGGGFPPFGGGPRGPGGGPGGPGGPGGRRMGAFGGPGGGPPPAS